MQMADHAANVHICGVNKWYPGEVHAVIDMEMEIEAGEFLVFVGPSGCGKTTLLRMIAGLETISSGTIAMGDRIINRVPPKNRDMAMVFQNYALYPNMRVRENIAFPLKMRRTEKREAAARVAEVAQKLALEGLMERKPGALSGGQRQRVALARAMVREPKLFLMDEPLSNLDAKLRTEMRREIVALQRELGVTTVYVTHDQTEAMTMGTRIAVMNGGVLQQIGTPREIYEQPANLFVAGFIGHPGMNFWDTSLAFRGDCLRLCFGDADIPVPARLLSRLQAEQPMKAGLRPEHVLPAADGDADAFPMIIAATENTGRETAVFLTSTEKPKLTMVAGGDFTGRPGDVIAVKLQHEKLYLFDAETETAIW